MGGIELCPNENSQHATKPTRIHRITGRITTVPLHLKSARMYHVAHVQIKVQRYCLLCMCG